MLNFLPVPAGVVYLGSRESTAQAFINAYGLDWHNFFTRELPQHTLNVPAFRLSTTPVTNVQYQAFIAAGGYTDRRWWTPSGWAWRVALNRTQPDFNTDPRFVGDNKPVVGVSWYEAYAFAKWAGGRLPTEAEWERAAKGDTQNLYPWGNKWDATRLNSGAGEVGTSSPSTTPVGQFSPLGDGPFGHQDLLGQVWEWCSSLYAPYPYTNSFGSGDFAAREDMFDPGRRVLRGGNWSDGRYCARNTCRYYYPPDYTDISIGFRVAANPLTELNETESDTLPVPPAPERELLIYGRSTFCPDLVKVKRFLFNWSVPYRQVNVDENREAATILEQLIGTRTVPTVVITAPGGFHPFTPPAVLPPGTPPRNYDRGTLMQEPQEAVLTAWIEDHQLVPRAR